MSALASDPSITHCHNGNTQPSISTATYCDYYTAIMDFSSLKDQVTNLTLYDIKAGVRKVQNGIMSLSELSRAVAKLPPTAVMNYTEMESKVREATNNEPWGTEPSILFLRHSAYASQVPPQL